MKINNFDLSQYSFQSKIHTERTLESIIAEHKKKINWYAVFLKDYLPKDKNSKIIDMPCGHGNFLYFLRAEGYKNFTGYDIEPGRIEIVKKLGLPGEIGNAIEIIGNSNNLDLIVSLDFIEHINLDDAVQYLAKCYKALKDSGKLIIRTPVTDSFVGARDLFNDITHKWAMNSGVIVSLFKQAGFEKVIIKDERPVPYKLLNRIRLIIFYFLKSITNIYLIALGSAPVKVWSASAFIIGIKNNSKST